MKKKNVGRWGQRCEFETFYLGMERDKMTSRKDWEWGTCSNSRRQIWCVSKKPNWKT